jgi:hypothetical protein
VYRTGELVEGDEDQVGPRALLLATPSQHL